MRRIWFLILAFPLPALGEVTRFEILERGAYEEGHSFGVVGPYERILGKVYFTLDPSNPKNHAIIDLHLAPTNAKGLVEFSCDLEILTPVDPSKGNRTILYDVNNRGNKQAVGFFNGGDGLLFEAGYTIVWSGWDGELLPGGDRLRLYPPRVKRHIEGVVRCEMVPESQGLTRTVINWDNHGSYRPVPDRLDQATLTFRERALNTRVPIPRGEYEIHVTEFPEEAPSQLPKVELEYPAGFRQGWIYELIYQAQDPVVHGVCFASVRDLIDSLQEGEEPGHPLLVKDRPKWAIGFGISQSGRFLREFLYSGFNEGLDGEKVFDGLMPHVSGSGMGSFNHRFAQPTRHVNQHDHHDYPADRFPFSYAPCQDPFTGIVDGLLEQARKTNTVPIVFQTQSAGEYWTRSGSLTHTDPLARVDLELPDEVRLYVFGGTQHGPSGYLANNGTGENHANHADFRPYSRALLIALREKIVEGKEPPPSRYPRIDQGTLVPFDQASTGFPAIPGVTYPQVIQAPPRLDLGPRFEEEGIVDHQPPVVVGQYLVRVPASDPTGNDLGCLLPIEVAVPLGTHTGWNVRRPDAGAPGELVRLGGSYIPFALRESERKRPDTRPTLDELYSGLDEYRSRLSFVADKVVEDRYLLQRDVQKLLYRNTEYAIPLFLKLREEGN